MTDWEEAKARHYEVEGRHYEVEGDDSDGSFAPPSVCYSCGQAWPCDFRAVLEEVERRGDLLEIERKQHLITKHCYDDVSGRAEKAEASLATETRAQDEALLLLHEQIQELEAKLAEANRNAEAERSAKWARLDKAEAEVERLREALGELADREELNLKHVYTTRDFGDSTNADRGCIWCRGEK